MWLSMPEPKFAPMSLSVEDAGFMARAIRLAERGLYTTGTNPRVGAVVVVDGRVVAEGWHQFAGGPHAEIAALNQLGPDGPGRAKGATVYVSLEPCSHQGKTGPCTQALIDAGVSRVVYGHEDPNPEVSATGLEMLREAGIRVDGPLMERDARALNPGFNKRMATGMPWVRVKLAMSLDARTAMPDNNSFWITGPKARADVQRLRGRSCALVTGWKTVDLDQASMTVRPQEFGLDDPFLGERQPLRVLVDSQCQLPEDARFFQAAGPVLVANLRRQESRDSVEWLQCPAAGQHVDLRALLFELAGRGCNEVMVEAGAGLAGAFFRLGLVDELVIYVAPKLMGSDARAMFDLPLKLMDESLPVRFADVRTIGRDIRITAIPETE